MPLQLDVSTLYLVSVAAAIMFGLITILLAGFAPEHRDVRLWGWGTLAAGGGIGLFTLRQWITEIVTVDLANMMVIGGYLLCLQSIRMLTGGRIFPPLDRAILGASAGIIVWFHHVVPDLHLRTAGVSLMVATVMLLAALQMALAIRDRGTASWKYTAGALAAYGLLHVCRTAVVLVTDYPVDRMVPQPVDGVLLLAFLLTNIGVALGVMWMHVERTQAQLRHLATHDPLTGLLNRSAFTAAFEREAARSARGGTPFSLVILDIDHFKLVNDRYGHLAGDQVLTKLATVVTGTLRPSDSVGRYGGEEFAVLIPEADQAGALLVAERMRSAVETARFDTTVGDVALTISAGVAGSPDGSSDWESLMQAADQALYRAKESGRNRVVGA